MEKLLILCPVFQDKVFLEVGFYETLA